MCDKKPIDVSELSETQLNGELEKGYQDIQEKRVKAAANVFAKMHINYKF